MEVGTGLRRGRFPVEVVAAPTAEAAACGNLGRAGWAAHPRSLPCATGGREEPGDYGFRYAFVPRLWRVRPNRPFNSVMRPRRISSRSGKMTASVKSVKEYKKVHSLCHEYPRIVPSPTAMWTMSDVIVHPRDAPPGQPSEKSTVCSTPANSTRRQVAPSHS